MSQRSISNTMSKLQKSVEDGKYYEAHQMYRTIVNRYMKQKNHKNAINLLESGAISLLKAAQFGSGADLGTYLVDVYISAKVEVNQESIKRIQDIANLFREKNVSEPSFKKFVDTAIAWSASNGPVPSGDPDLHHTFGSIYANYDFARAEHHFLLGNAASGPAYGRLLYDLSMDDSINNKSHYALRCVLGYLTIKNIQNAVTSLKTFITLTSKNDSSLIISNNTSDSIVIFTLPLLNFLQLLVLLVQKENAGPLFHDLKMKYQQQAIALLDQEAVSLFINALDQIGQLYFGINPPKAQQGNLLQDLMSSLFAPPPQLSASASFPSLPSTENLD